MEMHASAPFQKSINMAPFVKEGLISPEKYL